MAAELTDSRVCLVTGGGRNLGRQLCLTMAERGYDIVLTVRSDRQPGDDVAREVAERGRRAVVVAAELTDSSSVDGVAATALEQFGRIDVAVNNAAIRPRAPLLELTDADWHRVLDVNLSAPFYLCRAVLPAMIRQGSGCLIAIAGLVGYLGGGGGAAHIAASKAGLLGLTRAVADEFGPYGVRANVVVPSRMDTTRSAPADPAKVEAEIQATPLRRKGSTADVASTCAFLASDEASFITGQAIHVNGGFFKA